MSHTPGPDDFRFAAEWLRTYDDEHEGGKYSATAKLVAEWLDKKAEQKEIRALAFDLGVPVSKARAAIAKATEGK